MLAILLRPSSCLVVLSLTRGLCAAAQARPTTGSTTGPASASESHREANPARRGAVTSSASASGSGAVPGHAGPLAGQQFQTALTIPLTSTCPRALFIDDEGLADAGAAGLFSFTQTSPRTWFAGRPPAGDAMGYSITSAARGKLSL